jgi:hypothetical protein
LAVGNNGESLVADSSTSTGLRYQANFAAGKNKLLNGDFGIWQRGTSFTPTSGSFSADRFYNVFNGSGSTRTVSRQTFTPGTAPVAGYEGSYFLRYAVTVAGSGEAYSTLSQNIEDVRTLAGQTATFSFWAKAGSSITLPNVYAVQRFGSGGSAEVATVIGSSVAVTTSWQRFSYTFTMPSVSGKTIGTSSYVDMEFYTPLNSTFTLDTWGWQLEAGSVATAFQTATGTIQGELAACQRYYYRLGGASYASLGNAVMTSTTVAVSYVGFPQLMRTAPTINTTGTAGDYRIANATAYTCTAVPVMTDASFTSTSGCTVTYTSSGMTATSGAYVNLINNINAFLAFSAEL